MPAGLFSTPRPEPGHLLPAVGGAAVLALASPLASVGILLALAIYFALPAAVVTRAR
jgi:hypothetical protein